MPYGRVCEIGRGNFGIVDRVRDQNGLEFARKTFSPPNLPNVSEEDLKHRFEREVRYQGQINHPNVVRIIEFDLDASPPFFIMELAECSLADELAVDRTLGGDPRKPLFDILAGLQALHERGYKHRDLKPANVLKFCGPNGEPRYAISDFGLMTPGEGIASTLTASNMGGGTPLYRAPECVTNFRRATNQSDIYSFGAILHDIFAGGAQRLPHVELSAPGALNDIIQRCTKQNVRRRYPDVSALRQELYSALNTDTLVFNSQEEEAIVELLQTKDDLTDSEWDRVFQQIDENEDRQRSHHPILKTITTNHLTQLAGTAPELFASLGKDFARYAQNGVFDFDYCDVIASKAQVFYDLGELDLKAAMTIAMLLLGTRHNRWLVEAKFMQMAGPNISDELAGRIAAEVMVQGVDFEHHVRHVEGSIRANRANLHLRLQNLLVNPTQ